MPAQPTTECCPAEPAHPDTRQPRACQPLGRVLRELRRLSGQVPVALLRVYAWEKCAEQNRH